MKIFRVVLLSLLVLTPFAIASAQAFRSDDVVYAISYHPNFEGSSEADLFYVRGGEVTGPHATSVYLEQELLLDDLNRVPDGVMFDRADELVVADSNGVVVRTHKLPFPISHFVLDASGAAYASGSVYDTDNLVNRPTLAKVSPSGEILWTILFPPGAPDRRTNVTMDLARDQCTLWYSPATDGVGRYDVCRQVALSSITSEVASRIRILPDGGALLALATGVVRVDPSGSIVKTWPYATNLRKAVSISVAPDRRSFWVAEGNAPTSVYYHVDLATDAVLREVEVTKPFAITAFAVYGEWRAATSPANARRRGIRRQ
ncbi:MAG: NHL repeat-containing protein [Thermoanaerobaculia bacterium]